MGYFQKIEVSLSMESPCLLPAQFSGHLPTSDRSRMQSLHVWPVRLQANIPCRPPGTLGWWFVGWWVGGVERSLILVEDTWETTPKTLNRQSKLPIRGKPIDGFRGHKGRHSEPLRASAHRLGPWRASPRASEAPVSVSKFGAFCQGMLGLYITFGQLMGLPNQTTKS